MRWQKLVLSLTAAFTATSLSASSDPDDVVRSFVAALAAHDVHAFDPLALQPPINSTAWKWVRSVLHGSDCFAINGYRATTEFVSPDRVRAIVDVDGTATTGPNPPVLLATPWTLALERDAGGWHIAEAWLTVREIDQTNWVGRSQWWQSCADENIVPPPIFAYHVAEDASLGAPVSTRQIKAVDETSACSSRGQAADAPPIQAVIICFREFVATVISLSIRCPLWVRAGK